MTKENFSDKFYKLMVEYLGEEIFVSDSDGNVMFINQASSDTIGLPREEIIGKGCHFGTLFACPLYKSAINLPIP